MEWGGFPEFEVEGGGPCIPKNGVKGFLGERNGGKGPSRGRVVQGSLKGKMNEDPLRGED